MIHISKKVEFRITKALGNFQPIIKSAQDRDINEADTVTIVADILSELFGYDKYSEVTSEAAIRSTFCDLAIKINGKLKILIEVKSIGTTLKENHIRQAVDYGANEGIEWVVLTNAIEWRIFKIIFQKPINYELLSEYNILNADTKNIGDMENIYMLTKEGVSKSSLDEYYSQKQAINNFTVGAVILSDSCVGLIRRELKKMNPNIKVNPADIENILIKDVIKREIVDSEQTKNVLKKLKRTHKKQQAHKETQNEDRDTLPHN